MDEGPRGRRRQYEHAGASRDSTLLPLPRAQCVHSHLHSHHKARIVLSEENTAEACAEALRTLLDHIHTAVPPAALHDANVFRARCCYIEETDGVLRSFEEPLRRLFVTYAKVKVDSSLYEASLASAKGVGYNQWMLAVEDLWLIDFTPTCSHREATLAFARSRMCVVDESKERARLTNLTFEGVNTEV